MMTDKSAGSTDGKYRARVRTHIAASLPIYKGRGEFAARGRVEFDGYSFFSGIAINSTKIDFEPLGAPPAARERLTQWWIRAGAREKGLFIAELGKTRTFASKLLPGSYPFEWEWIQEVALVIRGDKVHLVGVETTQKRIHTLGATGKSSTELERALLQLFGDS